MPLRRVLLPALLITAGLEVIKTAGRIYLRLAAANPAYQVVTGAVGLLLFLNLRNQGILFAAALTATIFVQSYHASLSSAASTNASANAPADAASSPILGFWPSRHATYPAAAAPPTAPSSRLAGSVPLMLTWNSRKRIAAAMAASVAKVVRRREARRSRRDIGSPQVCGRPSAAP